MEIGFAYFGRTHRSIGSSDVCLHTPLDTTLCVTHQRNGDDFPFHPCPRTHGLPHPK
jgi:hypothetical protein